MATFEKPRIRVPAVMSRTVDSFVNLNAHVGIGLSQSGGVLNQAASGSYQLNPITRNRLMLEWAYRGSWIVRNAVDAIPEDMVREGINITSTLPPDEIEIIERTWRKLHLWTKIAEAAKWGRLYGGCLAVLLIEGQDWETPLRPETIGPGAFKGLMVLDRWLLQPTLQDLVSEYGPYFGKPRYYEVVADYAPIPRSKIHYTRCIRFDGEEMPFWQRINENLWSMSILEPLWDRLVAFDSTTNGIGQLVYKAHLRVVRMKDLRENVAAGGQRLQGVAKMLDNMRMWQTNEGITLLDSEDEFQANSYGFAGLSDVLDKFAEQLAGATKIPVVRLFGTSPGGLNATGDSDIRNYYDSIHQMQEDVLRDPITVILDIMHYSELKRKPEPGFTFEFAPLWQLDEKERAEVAASVTDTITKGFESGIISQKVALNEMRQSSRITGIWSNIDDSDIDAADSTPPIAQQSEMGQMSGVGETVGNLPVPPSDMPISKLAERSESPGKIVPLQLNEQHRKTLAEVKKGGEELALPKLTLKPEHRQVLQSINGSHNAE